MTFTFEDIPAQKGSVTHQEKRPHWRASPYLNSRATVPRAEWCMLLVSAFAGKLENPFANGTLYFKFRDKTVVLVLTYRTKTSCS